MPIRNWNDLRYLLAVKRGRSLAGAARLLGVDDTTVARRLAALRAATGAELCRRAKDGTLALTATGEKIARHAESMEHETDLIGEALGADQAAIAGLVRITTVPIIVNRLLAPAIGALLDRHPELTVELVPDARDFSLARREADIALRLARPKTGGTGVTARRIGDIAYGVYASRDVSATETLPWIGYEDALAHLPPARWMAALQGRDGRRSGLRVQDAETALEAAIAGLGRTTLPRRIAEREGRLRRLEMPADSAALSRELWLLAHRDQLALRRIRTVTDWIETLFRAPEATA